MARQSKKDTVLKIATTGNWIFSAALAIMLCIIAFVVIPTVTNPIFKPMAHGLRSLGLFLAAIFGIIALVKYLLQKRVKSHSSLTVIPNANAPSGVSNEASSASVFDNTSLKLPSDWSLKLIQDIEWKKFEELSIAYYQEKGIRAESTSLGSDGGIDIKLCQDDTGKPTSIVRCKASGSRQVGVNKIREFLRVMTLEKIAKGFYMTSGEYSIEAKEAAAANKITLINGVLLLTMIKRLPELSQKKLLVLATMGDYTTPTCSTCDIKMLRRSGKRVDFWGCKYYPRCKQMLHLMSTKL